MFLHVFTLPLLLLCPNVIIGADSPALPSIPSQPPPIISPPPLHQLLLELAYLLHELPLLQLSLLPELGVLANLLERNQRLLVNQQLLGLLRGRPRSQMHERVIRFIVLLLAKRLRGGILVDNRNIW